MDKIQQLAHEAKIDMAHAGLNGGIGFGGTFAAMSINDWMGFCVGLLTAIYMLFQIEAAYRKRRIAIRKEQEFLNGKHDV